MILSNPVDRLNQTHAWYKVDRRQTLIKNHELADWFAATLQLNNETTRDYLYLMLFTGLRRSEASRIQWNDVDFDDKTLTINETINHQVHVLPLSDYLYKLLKKRSEDKSSPYVFPSVSECGHLTEPRTAVKRVAELSGINFTLHDLRRTFIAIAESLDIPGDALKRLLNENVPYQLTTGDTASNVARLRQPVQQITDFIIKNSHKFKQITP